MLSDEQMARLGLSASKVNFAAATIRWDGEWNPQSTRAVFEAIAKCLGSLDNSLTFDEVPITRHLDDARALLIEILR